MATLHPDRIIAIWLRSGSALMFAPKLEFPQPVVPDGVYSIPMMSNPGIKEMGKLPYGGTLNTFKAYRAHGAPDGFAPDPLTAHETGDSRYLAIPWLDAFLAMRLPDKNSTDQKLKPVDNSKAWLAAPESKIAVPAAQYKGKVNEAVWLPNAKVAKEWMEYVKTGSTSDITPPPAPFDVTATDGPKGRVINWNAEADFESGIKQFIIFRDGREIGRVAEIPFGQYGRPLFQSMNFHDTPVKPLAKMTYNDYVTKPGEKHSYTVVSINSVGLESKPSKAAN
jgi:hypothetical protein